MQVFAGSCAARLLSSERTAGARATGARPLSAAYPFPVSCTCADMSMQPNKNRRYVHRTGRDGCPCVLQSCAMVGPYTYNMCENLRNLSFSQRT